MAQAQVKTAGVAQPGAAPGQAGATTGGRKFHLSRRAVALPLIALAAAGGVTAWFFLSRPALPAGFASGNGRLEANQIFISNKYAGRIAEILVREGDTVEAGQVVARMDTSALDAQLREAEAQIRSAQDARQVAQAQIDARQADYDFAAKQDQLSRKLVRSGAVSEREADTDHASALSTRAQLAGARSQEVQSVSQIDAAKATADRLRAEIKDAVLVSPIRARVQRRLAEVGEVLPAGGRVYSVDDLSDVYMYVFLPTAATGKLALGSEARIVLDAASQYPIGAFVSYISPIAQFTPKTVETAEERHDLTFRVKLQIPADRLRQVEPLVKSGLPGVGYVRWATDTPWPARLQPHGLPPNLRPSGSATAETR